MKRFVWVSVVIVLTAWAWPTAAAPEGPGGVLWIGAPEAPPTAVDSTGGVLTDWGRVALELVADGNVAAVSSRQWVPAPFPNVVTTARAGTLELAVMAYRAQVWPSGLDVIEGTVTNRGGAPAAAELALRGPSGVSWGETEGLAGARLVARLPRGLQVLRKERDWGCVTPATLMPGWARPERECDPAFRNIRAGMGGIPIVYRLKVEPGSSHKVVLGVCESHWAIPGQRPVAYSVEGASREVVDPIAEWGRHVPGCVYFDARDRNGDGVLEVTAAPVEGSADLNPILNVIWVFPATMPVNTRDVIVGKLNAKAEYYVDVGGPGDRDFYEGGDLRYPVAVGPGESRTLRFLLAAGGQSIPTERSAPLPERELADAAARPWEDWLAGLEPALRARAETLGAVETLGLVIAQQDDFYAALTQPGPLDPGYAPGVHSMAAWALDEAGLHAPAERLLRMLWDTPAAPAFAPYAASDGGVLPNPGGAPHAQAIAVFALAHHAAITKDRDWSARAWPRLEKLAADLLAADGKASGEWSRSALIEVAIAATLAGADAKPYAAAAERLRGFPAPPLPAGPGLTADAARAILEARGAR